MADDSQSNLEEMYKNMDSTEIERQIALLKEQAGDTISEMPPPSNIGKSEFKKKKGSAEGKKEKFADDVEGKGKGKNKKDSEDLKSHEKVID